MIKASTVWTLWAERAHSSDVKFKNGQSYFALNLNVCCPLGTRRNSKVTVLILLSTEDSGNIPEVLTHLQDELWSWSPLFCEFRTVFLCVISIASQPGDTCCISPVESPLSIMVQLFYKSFHAFSLHLKLLQDPLLRAVLSLFIYWHHRGLNLMWVPHQDLNKAIPSHFQKTDQAWKHCLTCCYTNSFFSPCG